MQSIPIASIRIENRLRPLNAAKVAELAASIAQARAAAANRRAPRRNAGVRLSPFRGVQATWLDRDPRRCGGRRRLTRRACRNRREPDSKRTHRAGAIRTHRSAQANLRKTLSTRQARSATAARIEALPKSQCGQLVRTGGLHTQSPNIRPRYRSETWCVRAYRTPTRSNRQRSPARSQRPDSPHADCRQRIDSARRLPRSAGRLARASGRDDHRPAVSQ
jgi:hypothetical protein